MPPKCKCKKPQRTLQFRSGVLCLLYPLLNHTVLLMILAIFVVNVFVIFTVMIYFRPTLQKVQSITRDAFFILDSVVHRITGSTVMLANAKSSLSRVLSLSLPALSGIWMNVTQDNASQVLSKLTSAQVSLLAGAAALEGSEHVKAHFLADSTSGLQLLLAEIADKESRIKVKGADVALRLSVLSYCRRVERHNCPTEAELDDLEHTIIQSIVQVDWYHRESREHVASVRAGVRALVAETENAKSAVWLQHYQATWWGWHLFSPAAFARAGALRADLDRLEQLAAALELGDQHLVSVLSLQYARTLVLQSWGRRVLLNRHSIVEGRLPGASDVLPP